MPRKGGSKNEAEVAEAPATEGCEGKKLNEYEQQHAARIADNQARMESAL